MRQKNAHVLVLALVLATAQAAMLQGREAKGPQTSKPHEAPTSSQLITKNSVGPVRLSMTIAQARKAMSKLKFARTTDGDGLALIELKSGETVEMILYAGEENSERPINEQAKIQMISAYGKEYVTTEGVHPGMLLSEVEQKYGKITKIVMSEIESREYADFPKKPNGLLLQVGLPDIGVAGKYPEDKRETKSYLPSAVITNIEIRETVPNH